MQEAKEEKHKARVGLRGVSRFCAVQAMYGAGLCNRSLNSLMDDFNAIGGAIVSDDFIIPEMDKPFLKKLLETADRNLLLLDKVIAQHLSSDWKLERIDYVLRCILRLGLTELMFFKEIPVNVIFNEYIEISKAFFENSETSFINGLLNEASKNIRD